MTVGMARALIVEDDGMVARALRLVLSSTVDVVGAVADFGTALRTMEHDPVDLVLVDYDLGPGPTGLDLAEIVHTRWPDAVVFIVSAGLDARLMRRAVAAGVSACFAKPLQPSELIAAIHAACG